MNNSTPLLSRENWNQLIEVSRFTRPATVWIQAKKILNIFTGETNEGHIAIYKDRIAYVGNKQPMQGSDTVIVDASEYTLVPGYMEPHSHPFQIYNPLSVTEYALSHGTTSMVHDNLFFYISISEEEWDRFILAMSALPVKNYWWARLDPQTQNSETHSLFSPERIGKLLSEPYVLQAGELTGWKDLLEGDPQYRERMFKARVSGKRIEAHNPGASIETLNAITAAGATCCHESITTEEVLRRLRLGLYASLRYSSIRPDLPQLLKGLLDFSADVQIPWNRLLMTTDGSPPFFLKEGFTDHLIKLAMDAGVKPLIAYQMATINPASYYGLEKDLGAIAPGRLADILFLEDLSTPTPRKVFANGKLVADEGRILSPAPSEGWTSYGMVPWPEQNWRPIADWFHIPWDQEVFPVVTMLNAVILGQQNQYLPMVDGRIALPKEQTEYVYVALLDREAKWITRGIVKGFAWIDALASTYTVSGDLLIIGRDPQQMAKAASKVLEMRGGICVLEKGEVLYELRLPLLGGMSKESMDKLIPLNEEFVLLLRQRGYQHEDPIYTIFFFTATHLPFIRWTREGLLDVKSRKVVLPAQALR